MAESPSVMAYTGSRARLHALIEASMALNASPDLRTLLRRILDLATAHVGADRGALFRLDPDSGDLTATIFHGDELAEIQVEAGHGLAGEVATTGQSIRIADAYADDRFDPSVDARTGYRTHSVLVVPLRLRDGDLVGVLQVLNKKRGEFDEDDEAFLQAFGAQAAVALETARLIEERVREERLAGIGQVAAMLVHDLRNPLSGLMGYASVIEQQPPEEIRERCLAGIRRQAARMQDMVKSILGYVRGDAGFLFTKTDVDELLQEVVADLDAAHRDHELDVKLSGDTVGTARVDPMALRRVLDNLARNAVEAMDGKGTLTLHAHHADDTFSLEVRDTGEGMSEALQRRLFDAYVTHGKEEGTGLGLNVVKRIVEAHDGTLDVTSQPHEGTTIRLRLPYAGPADPPA